MRRRGEISACFLLNIEYQEFLFGQFPGDTEEPNDSPWSAIKPLSTPKSPT
jgi:hypothetical protein